MVRDQYGNEYEQTSGGDSGCFLFLIGIVFVIAALPIAIFWKILMRGFYKPRYRKLNVIKNSLNEFKRWVLMVWVTIIYGSQLLDAANAWGDSLSGTRTVTTLVDVQSQAFSQQYGALILSLIAIVLIGVNFLILKSKGLNPWAGVEKVKYKSVTHAIGVATFIFLGTFGILSVFLTPGITALITVIVGIASYYVIENFL